MVEERGQVILEPAYFWRCPKCRKRNFCKAVPVEWTEENIREELELESWQPIPESFSDDEYLWIPSVVHCSCGAEFDSVDKYSAGEDASTAEGEGEDE